jgi:hypothetical protein
MAIQIDPPKMPHVYPAFRDYFTSIGSPSKDQQTQHATLFVPTVAKFRRKDVSVDFTSI